MMTLPVSKYEELLETVRNLKHQTIQVRELASPLLDTIISANTSTESPWPTNQTSSVENASVDTMNTVLTESQPDEPPNGAVGSGVSMWYSEPSTSQTPPDAASVMSFASSSGAAPLDLVLGPSERDRLDAKADVVYGLLAALGGGDAPDMSDTLLALSASADGGRTMRQAGCVAALVHLLHTNDASDVNKAAQALRNLVLAQPDERLRKRELKVLRLLEEIRSHCALGSFENSNVETNPTQSMEQLIKLSFDECYRQAICELGGIQTLALLLQVEQPSDCITLRRYASMALTNLTFGHSRNKALLCSQPNFLSCLIQQLGASSEELRQGAAGVLRNLSWRADSASRVALRRAGAVPALVTAAMKTRKEPALRALLSALWNLSAHCSTNKSDLCAVSGALAFLVDMLAWKAPSRTLTIVENAGGVLRNISSHVAVREDYRSVLRDKGALPLLLQQLRSPSLTVVANACGTLWNLSAKCERDQQTLLELGAAPMLRSLNHSKHALIATGSRAALKNLLSSHSGNLALTPLDSTARALGLPALPTLGARRQRALAQQLASVHLTETCDNLEAPSAAADYAETDLDTPTDFSLRYPEDDSDDKDEPATDTIRTYCTEGTPYETPRNFSTATSMSDLRCVDAGSKNQPPRTTAAEKASEGSSSNAGTAASAKETPLMFSRCSSLGSLSSAEQHSIHDDRSSVVSDLSRLTSGIVSPSELPDSPTQTVPQSPRRRPPPAAAPRSVFDDNVMKFKEVNTPAEFSTATSLSALTIDDEATPAATAAEPEIDADVADEQAEDDMLAACIDIGMRNNRLKQQTPSDDDALLTECIEAALPKSRPRPQRLAPSVRDEITRYSVEDSPCQFSLRSSLSDLTFDPPPEVRSRTGSQSSLSDADEALLEQCIRAGMPKSRQEAKNAPSASAAAGQTPNNAPAATDVDTIDADTAPLDANSGFKDNLLLSTNPKLDDISEDNISPTESTEQNRMFDPDAMIASLDRFTAELVSHVQHLPQHDCKLENTWTDSSPNDISCPSISVTAPLPLTPTRSFPSESVEDIVDPNTKTSELSHSTLIAMEATRLAADLLHSIELENTQPPSVMNSLISLTSCTSDVAVTTSTTMLLGAQSARNSPVAARKRSLPVGLLVRRALSHSASNLDHVQPPSLMTGDFFDVMDLENSMISVASITSEIASEADVIECTEIINTTPVPLIETNTPRRRHPTPKQRRQSAQERYRTYTVIPTDIYSITNTTSTSSSPADEPATISTKVTPRERRQLDRSRFQTRVLDGNSIAIKPTPRDRRREDAERYRTRTLSVDSPAEDDFHSDLAQQANIVLDTLRADELIDCETLSLVSNEDDSELTSGSSSKYRTYHKSWGLKNKHLPVVKTETMQPPKPKIIKPSGKTDEAAPNENDASSSAVSAAKTVRGRRKPLYSKQIARPIKNATTSLKTIATTSTQKSNVARSASSQRPQISKMQPAVKRRPSSQASTPSPANHPLERQNTFTKEDTKKSRIPTAGSRRPAQNQPPGPGLPQRSLSHVERPPVGTSKIAGLWRRSNTTATSSTSSKVTTSTTTTRVARNAKSAGSSRSVETTTKKFSRFGAFIPGEQISVT